MSDNGLTQAAQQMLQNLQNDNNPQIQFAQLFSIFKGEIDQLMDEIAKFELTEDNLKSFKKVRHLYNQTMAGLGGNI
jgi:hypothetical protein